MQNILIFIEIVRNSW